VSRLLFIALGGAVCLLLAACTAGLGVSCPAIGYGNVARVSLAEPRGGLNLELCSDAPCELEPAPSPMSSPSPEEDIDSILSVPAISGSSEGGWDVSFTMYAPASFGYVLRDSADAVVGSGEVAVEWTRVDGSEECGGNGEAIVVIPA